MFCDKHLRSLKVLSFVFSLLASPNIIATVFSLKLLSVKIDEYYPFRVAVYTKCSVIFYLFGLFGCNTIRGFIASIFYPCIPTIFVIYLVDAICSISMYTQPLACSVVMLYGHYTQKWWFRTTGLTFDEEPSSHRNVAAESEPVPTPIPVVVGQTVHQDGLTSFERLVLQYLQEPIHFHQQSPRSQQSPTIARGTAQRV